MSFEIIHCEEDFADSENSAFIKDTLALGLKVPTSVKTPVGYLDSLRYYKDIYNDQYKQMEVANKLYKYNGIIGNAVDILIDFAVTEVRPMPTGNDELDKVLEEWFISINQSNTNGLPGIYSLMQEMCLEWFTSGNVFPYNKWENVTINGLSGSYKLPSVINLINPQSIYIPTSPLAFGQELIYLKYDSDLVAKLQSDGRSDPEAAILKQAIPRTVLNNMVKNSSMDGIRLNSKYVKHLKRRAKGYQPWGVPYLARCFPSSTAIERLRELDNSITEGLINLVTIFKVGTDEHPASPIRLSKLKSLLTNPKATTTLVWAHDIEVEQVGPDGKLLAFKDKYREAKTELLTALGVPPVLMGLEQGSRDWIPILALIERLSHWRKTMSTWLDGLMEEIAEYNGFDNIHPKSRWARMNLVNDAEIKNLILAFYDRGLISIPTALKDSGYDINHELYNKKIQKEYEEEFVPPSLPFSGDSTQPKEGRTPDGDVKKDTRVKTKKSDNTVDLKQQKKKEPKIIRGKDAS